MNEFIITIDVDWAPDIAIETVATVLIQYGIKATWFITHNSPAIASLQKETKLFELGIHPNFLPGSTHGKTVREVLDYVMAIVPDAISMRSHAVFQSGPILSEIVLRTPIRHDSSIFLPEMPFIQAVKHLTPYGLINRIPFFWADDYEMLKVQPDWSPERFFNFEGLKVLMFHPIHVFLNSHDHNSYNKIKKEMTDKRGQLKYNINNFVKTGEGAHSFFLKILKSIKHNENNSFLLREIE